jgi:hypothetical protein
LGGQHPPFPREKMGLNKKMINKILSRSLMALGILFLIYVAAMYYAYFFTDWQKP